MKTDDGVTVTSATRASAAMVGLWLFGACDDPTDLSHGRVMVTPIPLEGDEPHCH